MSTEIKESLYQVQVLDRALGILDVLSSEGSELAPAELSKRLDLHKSTTHRLLMVLERHRLIEKSLQTGKYRLGLKLFELGSKAVAQLDLSEQAHTYLERLVRETGETAHLCIVDAGETLSLTNVESTRTIRTPVTVGRRTPVHCTAVGKAVLAFMDEYELKALIKKQGLKACTPNTITTLAGLKAELQLVRKRGYAVDNEEIEEELKCIGAPVRNYSGKVIAAISIAGPAYRLPDDKIPVVARSVVEAANELSLELGYQTARDPQALVG
ncbi:MAG: IclR family transcriptional regulator [Pyrinomonadaceae bacterium]|nr:IclR family transcriptional regulator [Pyrinomonadaceae bacterium]